MKKLIPPVLFLLSIAGMVTIKYVFPAQGLVSYPVNLLGIVLIVAGLGLTIIARKQFEKVSTEIHTFRAPGKLVTDGLFNYSRNPIYLGFTIALIGVWFALNHLFSGALVLIFMATANFWYIPYEEEQMTKEFGERYEAYKSKTRKWL